MSAAGLLSASPPPPPSRTPTQARIDVMGLPVDRVTEDEAVRAVVEPAAAGQGGWVITPNLDQLRRFTHEPALRPYFRAADLVVADGMPLVWATKLAGAPLPERVAGSDLIWSVSRAAADHSLPIFLLGGNPGAAEGAREVLQREIPALDVAGVRCPPHGFEHDRSELHAITAHLRSTRPAIVFVALGFPKQEALIARLRRTHPRMWFLGVGVSLSFVAGEIARAPAWMQKAGVEWAHRLVQEPRRLFRRYVRDGLPFAGRLLVWGLEARRR